MYRFRKSSPLSYSAALKSFKSLLSRHGFDSSRFALHSPRIGGATDCFLSHVPLEVIDAKGRWKSGYSKYSYLRVPESSLVRASARAVAYS